MLRRYVIFSEKQAFSPQKGGILKKSPAYPLVSVKCCTFAAVLTPSPDGGIGRRAGLKHQWGNPCRFDPGSGYMETLVEMLCKGFFFYTTQIWSPFGHFFQVFVVSICILQCWLPRKMDSQIVTRNALSFHNECKT